MAKHGVAMRLIDPQWGSWAVSVANDFIACLFQSREVSCVEVQVNDTKMRSPYTSEVIDLNGLSMLFVPWKMQTNVEHIWWLSVSSICICPGRGLSFILNYPLLSGENPLQTAWLHSFRETGGGWEKLRNTSVIWWYRKTCDEDRKKRETRPMEVKRLWWWELWRCEDYQWHQLV